MESISGKCIHQLFEEQARATPNAIAVIFENQQLTYRELNRRANQLAHYLITQHTIGTAETKAAMVVGICLERSLDSVVGLLGILKAGGIYLPLEPNYPQKRLIYMLEDAQATMLLTQKAVAQPFTDYPIQTLCLDREWPSIATHDVGNPITYPTPEQLAYLIYTSGSTGKPKGVMVEHQALVTHLTTVTAFYGVTARDRILQFASTSFDVALEQIFLALITGAGLVIRDHHLWTTATFDTKIAEHRITVADLPPAYFHQLVQQWQGKPPTFAQRYLRLILVGGERTLPETVRLWQRLPFAKTRLVNAYGPTEATITATCFDLTTYQINEQETRSTHLPIGKPLPGRLAYILDADLQQVPVGVVGELYLGGASLARGYLNRPDLTAEHFIANPLHHVGCYPRLYKTGDLVRQLANGHIEFLGRVDDQVQVRGYRVELGEIEEVLSQHPAVQEAAVVARKIADHDAQLTAYIVGQERHQQNQLCELWPSVGEYPVYDELLYYAMTYDEPRNRAYQKAIQATVPGKTVVEIGTGKDAILSLFCAQAGAKKIYAIELDQNAAEAARARVDALGFADQIEIIHGNALTVTLPEQVDVCVSEIIGTIGGSEGVAAILNDARRFLKPDGVMVPSHCHTRIAAVTLPDAVRQQPTFTELTGHYTQTVFDVVGYPFDLRLCLKHFPTDHLLSDSGLFESLDFTASANVEAGHTIQLKVKQNGRLDGFLLWLNLHTMPGIAIDTLTREYSWLPVFFPVFEPGIQVVQGDVVAMRIERRLSDNQINPDYLIQGRVTKTNGTVVEFDYASYHHATCYRQTPFYQRLFKPKSSDSSSFVVATEQVGEQREQFLHQLRSHLRQTLPEHMVPSAFVIVDALPLTPNGKIDRHALPAPTIVSNARYADRPRTLLEQQLLQVWQETLATRNPLAAIGIHDNFFEQGGHSLLAIQLLAKLREHLACDLSLHTFFANPTVAMMAASIHQMGANMAPSSLVAIQARGTRSPLICLPGAGGGVLYFHALARAMGNQQPCYALESVGLDGKMPPLTSVEAIAAYHIAELHRSLPNGPYNLVGHSFGGFVAFEMAQQLHRAGVDVNAVVILDIGAPTGQAVSMCEEELILFYERRFLEEYGLEPTLTLAQLTPLAQEERLLLFKQSLENAGIFPPNSSLEQIRGVIQVAAADLQAMAYTPQNFSPLPIHLFVTDGNSEGEKQMMIESWSRYGDVTAYEVSGTHMTMLYEPQVQVLAQTLTACLAY
ncbi:MAG: amino acid adenylation domain-containing protein [Caldilineaceae bacterium]